jgi:hypothetical protein
MSKTSRSSQFAVFQTADTDGTSNPSEVKAFSRTRWFFACE